MDKTLNVFFAVSKTYAQHFTVALTSLLENNKALNFEIFLIIDKSEISYFNIPVQFIQSCYGIGISIIDTGNVDFSNFKTTPDFPKHTYFRLFLADFAPKSVDVALFLDADVIVTGSIAELADIDMNNEYIAAVSETSVKDNVIRLKNIGSTADSYFNAGVILVNIKRWRDEKLSDKFMVIAEQQGDLLEWVDQDILNIYFANRWLPLDKKFNGIHIQRKLSQIPLIIHFNSFSKPWYYVDTHPYKYLYKKYLLLTPYRNKKPMDITFKNFIIKNGRLFKRKLRDIGILNINSNDRKN